MAAVTGLDVGHRTVRACVLERSGKALRVRACAEVSRLDDQGEAKALPAVIAELDAKVQFAGPVVCSMSDISALVRFVSTLPLPPDRLARLLRLELSQHADDGGDLAADTMIVPIPSDELMHLCVLAQPAQVYSSLIDLREAGVRSPQIHFGPAAAYNATLPLPPVRDSALALLIDVGSDTTGITLFGEDRLLACRQVPVGGDAFTEAMVAAGRDRGAAERAKREPPAARPESPTVPSDDPFAKMLESGLELHDDAAERPSTPPATPAPLPEATTGGVPLHEFDDHEEIVIEDAHPSEPEPEPESEPIVPAPAPTPPMKPFSDRASPPPARADELDPALARPAEALFGQIVSSLTWFKSQLKLRSIELKLVCLAGGGAGLPGLTAYLQRRLSVPVQLLDPFAGIDAGPKPERAHEYAAAAGLALSERSMRFRHAARFDLRPDTMVRRELWRTRLAWPFAAAALVVIATVFAMFALHARYEAARQSIANYNSYRAEYESQKKRLDELDAQKNSLTDDLRAIASRIYAGRDLLYTIRALKERTEKSPQLWVTKLQTRAIAEDTTLTQDQVDRGDIIEDAKDNAATTIERGAVVISGLVKFDSKLNWQGFRDFIGEWKDFVLNWSPAADQPRLFKRAQELGFGVDTRETGGSRDKPAGEVPWTWAFYFAPTDLSQVTSVRVAPDTGKK